MTSIGSESREDYKPLQWLINVSIATTIVWMPLLVGFALALGSPASIWVAFALLIPVAVPPLFGGLAQAAFRGGHYGVAFALAIVPLLQLIGGAIWLLL
ncbi:hypothetical protein ABIC83_002852 [Roseateles asaccharophilus]|uniref:hypothetical protein n=1 Tax=Roseateles asaccharophilus TaxID=582607 RepID=UPI00383338AE